MYNTFNPAFVLLKCLHQWGVLITTTSGLDLEHLADKLI